MELNIKIEDLKKIGLTLTQYITLWGIYNSVKIKYIVTDEEGINDLKTKGYMVQAFGHENFLLTKRGLELFEPPVGIFDEFIQLFPTRVKDAAGIVRILSPEGPNTLAGQKLRRKWHAITKTNTELQNHIIECLKEEVELRKKEGNLYWMRNAETWLNKCTWEDYEYLLKREKKEETERKVGEIRL
jgi:hypothetical protein